MKHTLVALLRDRPGVLNRAVSLFRRRGFNIESLAVGHSEQPGVSRMTLVVDADEVEQVVKQLNRLIDVLKVSDVTNDARIERETALVKVHAPPARRQELLAVARVFGARVVDLTRLNLVLELTAAPQKVANFVDVIRPFGLQEMVRSERITLTRGTGAEHAAPAMADAAHARPRARPQPVAVPDGSAGSD